MTMTVWLCQQQSSLTRWFASVIPPSARRHSFSATLWISTTSMASSQLSAKTSDTSSKLLTPKAPSQATTSKAQLPRSRSNLLFGILLGKSASGKLPGRTTETSRPLSCASTSLVTTRSKIVNIGSKTCNKMRHRTSCSCFVARRQILKTSERSINSMLVNLRKEDQLAVTTTRFQTSLAKV